MTNESSPKGEATRLRCSCTVPRFAFSFQSGRSLRFLHAAGRCFFTVKKSPGPSSGRALFLRKTAAIGNLFPTGKWARKRYSFFEKSGLFRDNLNRIKISFVMIILIFENMPSPDFKIFCGCVVLFRLRGTNRSWKFFLLLIVKNISNVDFKIFSRFMFFLTGRCKSCIIISKLERRLQA